MKTAVGQGIRVIGISAAAAAVVIAAPAASAEGNTYSMSVAGTTHVSGCTYKLSIDNPPIPASATFYDNGKQIGNSSGSANLDRGLHVQWTPASGGTHTLTATMGYLSAAVWVTPLTVEVAASGSCTGGGLSSILPSFSG